MFYFTILSVLILIYMMYAPLIILKLNYKINKKKFIIIWIKRLFSVYILFLIYVLFLNRKYTNIITLVPFETINRYFRALKNNNIEVKFFISNIIGNLLLFAPMGFFIPIIFNKKIKNIFSYMLVNLLIILSAEITQYITKTGSCDIDDVILNFLGAIIFYLLLKLKSVKKIINIIFSCDFFV